MVLTRAVRGWGGGLQAVGFKMVNRSWGDLTLCSSKRCCKAVSRSCLSDSTASSAGP